ncbi:MAG: diguanylate cyclase domain-containing protein [Solirubrobacterales bacterium]
MSDNYTNIKHIYTSRNSNIFTAVNKLTGKPVIFKTINESFVDEYGFAKLKNEYNILSKIKSEFVPEAIEYSKVCDDYYLVLEYCDGISLLNYMKEQKISSKEFLCIALQIVRGLSDIHKAGVIHKDINPANIIYNSKTGKISIIDFGLSTEFTYEKSLNMEADFTEGTLYYISPEQTGRMNHNIDFRTDFYSLGVTFFEMLCGCPPFNSESPTEMIYLHLAKLPPDIKEINPSVPDMISSIIYKLMSKMPEERYSKAEGVLFDISKCLETITLDNEISSFQLGSADYSDRFEIKPKLYGREIEIYILISSYYEILNGGKTFVTIAGHSGIGKTSLVAELQKPIANSKGILISGKFDQYHRNIPYIAITQAIDQFCDFILSEDEKNIETWKTRITSLLKQEGKILVKRIPKLALIAGKPQNLSDFSPLEECTRFKAALQDLLAMIASPDRPLVMFIDDIHFADVGSLEIIEEIMSNDKISGLEIVACYRDNEVDRGHPLVNSINKMKNRQVNIQQITLTGIAVDSVKKMITDALHGSTDSVTELAGIIYNKTNGNPFYIKQFLKVCISKEYIFFDSTSRVWKWNIEAIKETSAEENVVNFLIRNVNEIPFETKQLLSLGACIGQIFKVNTLSKISGKKIEQILQDLKLAVSLEVVYPIKNKVGINIETEFHFSHDRFQQTFYAILPEEERNHIHYKLGAYYEKAGFGNNDNPEKQFLMADNYLKAFSTIDSEIEKRRVAEILLRAANLACVVSAFDTAIHYLEQIISSLEEIIVDDNFTYLVYVEYHSALCSMAKYQQADEIYALLENLVKEPVSLTDSCCLQAVSLSNRGRYKDAFMLGVELLDKFGVHFPVNNLLNIINKEIDMFYHELSNDKFPGIEKLPRAYNKLEFSVGKILNRICTAGFFYNPLYSFWSIITSAKRVLENGYTPEGLSLYGSLTLLLIPFRNDYKMSYNLALSAMKLAENNGYRIYRMYHLFSLVNCHWFENLKNSISYARQSCAGNIAVGDFEFACFTYFTTQQIVLETGENIDELIAESDSALAFAENHGNIHAFGSFISFRQLCKSLMTYDSKGSFDDAGFSESAHIAEINGNNMAICFFHTLRALSAVIYSDFDTAYEHTEKAAPLLPSITGFYANALHNFLNSISICKRLENKNCSEEEKTILNKKLAANQVWLNERAADAPNNFQHLYDFIEAERYMLENQGTDSFTVYRKMLLYYEKAMIGASENNRIYHYAIICELAGDQFIKMDSLRLGTIYLKEAHSAYLSWGATAKAEQLKEKHHELKRLRFNSLKYKEEFNITSITNSSIHSGMFLTNSSAIDFAATIKASQAISGETKIEAILEKLVSVLLENSGAQDIYYITKKDNDYFIEAEGHSEGEKVSIMQDKCIGTGTVPMKILNYVERTQESIIIDDATDSDMYATDEHILSHRCRSVMCMPVINKGVLKGILYLENNLIEGVFDKQRTEALRTIAAQLAISLENSYLFNNLQQLVEDRTRELREEIVVRKNAEKRLEQMANYDSLTNLPNRRMFQTYLDHSIELASMGKTNLAVLFIDLDGFKCINDTYGHDKGDIVLTVTAKRLVNAVRSCDTVSRMGGDEFVLILENVRTKEEIEKVCSRIVTYVEMPIEFDDLGVKAVVTSSIGISVLNFDGTTAEELISNADKAMYTAKNNGKNQFVFHSKLYNLI